MRRSTSAVTPAWIFNTQLRPVKCVSERAAEIPGVGHLVGLAFGDATGMLDIKTLQLPCRLLVAIAHRLCPAWVMLPEVAARAAFSMRQIELVDEIQWPGWLLLDLLTAGLADAAH